MTTFGSRGYMPFSKQSGNLINKKHNGTCCSVVDYGTKIFSLSTLSPMKDDLVGKKDWACEYILFSVIKIDKHDRHKYFFILTVPDSGDIKESEKEGEKTLTKTVNGTLRPSNITLYIAALSASTFPVSRIILLFDPSKGFADANNCRWIF